MEFSKSHVHYAPNGWKEMNDLLRTAIITAIAETKQNMRGK